MNNSTLRMERAIVASIMLDPGYALPVVNKRLTADEFADEFSRSVLAIYQEAHDSGEPMDPVLLYDKVEAMGMAFDVEQQIRELLTMATARNVEAYCDEVKKAAQDRRYMEAIASADGPEDLAAKLSLLKTEKGKNVRDGLSMMLQLNDHYWAAKENPEASVCRTGYSDLDKALGGGMQKSGLYIIGARPGMGKTTFALNIAEKVAKAGKTVLFVSLEMSMTQIAAKRAAIEGRIRYSDIMGGSLTDAMYNHFVNTINDLHNRPFFCIDQSEMTVNDIAAAARSVDNLQLIVIDYLGLIRASDQTKKLYEQVSEISRDLKALAKRLNVPVLSLCQVNRESTKTKNKKPTLADLRDSGSIEQDADGVIMLHRDDYYTNAHPTGQVDIELIIAKNRHGEGNTTIAMDWNGATGQITAKDNYHREE